MVRFAPNFNAPGVIDRAVAEGFIHPDYVPGEERQPYQEDIAVLILAEPVTDITPSRRAPLGFLEDLDAQGLLQIGPERTRMIRVGYGFGLDFPPRDYIPFDGVSRSEATFLDLERLPAPEPHGVPARCFADCSPL